MKASALAVLAVLGAPAVALAGLAPEIDLSAGPAALVLLAGALLVLRGRRGR